MMKKKNFGGYLILGSLLFASPAFCQITERERPKEWDQLIEGGKFRDLFEPIAPIGTLTSTTWGTDGVKPRYVDNGIEAAAYSYWGGNIVKGDDGKYHLFVCRWREDSPKGHNEWPNSIVVHSVSDSPAGPFKFVAEIGKGHNPEIYQTKSGAYVLYVIDGFYQAPSLDGPWTYGKFEFDTRDRPIIEGLSNLTFAQREDGSYLMICRGGGVWFSKDGLETFSQVSNGRVYPPVEGEFEDPVVWRDHIQYHLIVNDWLGRIAFYLRSKDGVHWKTDPGEAYTPGITVYEDGTNEDWFKYERIKIFQDEHGRAIQANFAVIDTLKKEDKPNDSHSSKNVGIPLKKGLLLEILDKKPLTADTKTIRVLIKSEAGFDPQTQLDVQSLRFGAAEEVNYGRGSKPLSHQAKGQDLEVVFEGKGNGFDQDSFAGKLIGKGSYGDFVHGFSRLPGVDYTPAILSTRKPVVSSTDSSAEVIVENFGLTGSGKARVTLELTDGGRVIDRETAKVQGLQPYGKASVKIPLGEVAEQGAQLDFRITIEIKGEVVETFDGKLEVL